MEYLQQIHMVKENKCFNLARKLELCGSLLSLSTLNWYEKMTLNVIFGTWLYVDYFKIGLGFVFFYSGVDFFSTEGGKWVNVAAIAINRVSLNFFWLLVTRMSSFAWFRYVANFLVGKELASAATCWVYLQSQINYGKKNLHVTIKHTAYWCCLENSPYRN